MGKLPNSFHYAIKSRFVRTVFLRVLAIFLIVAIAIVAIVFFSFSTEINKNIIADRQKQLAVIEDAISKRLDEISSIAFNIGADPSFYLNPMEESKYSGYEMCRTLDRYLVGNSFIEYLAYYRLAEPDKLYVSKGELSFVDFWCTYVGMDRASAERIISEIQKVREVQIQYFDAGRGAPAFFTYTCPLPQFSANPQAFVLMMIPVSEVSPLLESQLVNASGAVAVFDSKGNEIYRVSTLAEDIALDPTLVASGDSIAVTIDGAEYVVQAEVSDSNGWTYFSAIQHNDMISGLASKEIVFILLLLGLMFVGIFVLFICIVIQYRPISNLAESVAEKAGEGAAQSLDERELLSSTFATLQDDSEQKLKFETAYYASEAASKAKSTFFSSMSHDIRTPMNAIIGMTAIAYKHAEEPEYVRECLQKVQVASQYLLDIINNVLDMSRIESGRFKLSEEPVPLPELMAELITILGQSVEAKHQRLIPEVGSVRSEVVISDSVRLTQVFMNILSNAVKFTPEGGTITMSVTQTGVDAEGRGSYVFSFTDTGIGMTPEFVGRVFDTFSRASEGNASKVEGTGLGMAIAKNLVELMGGTIKCESELGCGTTFTVALSLRPAEPESDSELTRKLNGYKDAPVLLACGDERIRSCESTAFAAAGIHADSAADAAEAARLAASAQQRGTAYKLIVLNPTEGDRNGLSAVATIKRETASPCVLAVEGPSELNQAEAKEAGIGAFIQLPFFRSTILYALEGVFNGAAAQKDGEERIRDFAGKRVLIAEDNNMNREIACKIIGETHAEALGVENGQEAVDAFRAHPADYFDVILMDLQMPVLNGYEATAEIRSTPRPDAATVPIYALTASTFDEDVRQVREAGMNGHIGKPYSPEALFRALEQAFRR